MLEGTALRCYAHNHITTLPQKNIKKIFLSHACVWVFVSVMTVVPQPNGVRVLTSWPIVAFGSIPALMRHFLARQVPFSIILNRHAEARAESKLPGDESCPKKTAHLNFQEEHYTETFLCIVQSTQSAKHVKCSASSVLGTFLSPIAECTMSNNASTQNVTSTKEKR